ncbi:RsmB/NOP family class I SAM-dependent RNA methyltransferase [Rhodovibrionaceae bacterium A322]
MAQDNSPKQRADSGKRAPSQPKSPRPNKAGKGQSKPSDPKKSAGRKRHVYQHPKGDKPDSSLSDAKGDPLLQARLAALQVFQAVVHHRRPLDEVLNDHHGLADLEPRDRAFARLLVATLLRRLGQVDALIDACLDKPLQPRLKELRDLLRLGAVQLAFLGTPPHAAVSTAVNLCAQSRLKGFKNLVNAVLRRIGKESEELLAKQDVARLNTPGWLRAAWEKAYGTEGYQAIALGHLVDPPLDLTFKPGEDLAAWAEKLGGDVLPTGSLRLPAGQGEISRLPGYHEGHWWIQDVAASLPAKILGDVSGKLVFDLCAAPGGKTAQLAAAGAQTIALDLHEDRLERLRKNLERLSLAAGTVATDAATWQPPEAADAVLLDAPCSSTGTLRRHPDIGRLKSPKDIKGLVEAQARLLQACVKLVKPGGLLVYATCSLQREEGEKQIASFLASGVPFKRVAITPDEVPGLEQALTKKGELRCLPSHWSDKGGMDGFFVAKLKRTGSA